MSALISSIRDRVPIAWNNSIVSSPAELGSKLPSLLLRRQPVPALSQPSTYRAASRLPPRTTTLAGAPAAHPPPRALFLAPRWPGAGTDPSLPSCARVSAPRSHIKTAARRSRTSGSLLWRSAGNGALAVGFPQRFQQGVNFGSYSRKSRMISSLVTK